MTNATAAQAAAIDDTAAPAWSRTVEVDHEAAGRTLTDGEWCWLSPDIELAGWGTAARVTLTGQTDRAQAGALLARRLAGITDIDAVVPGPVAFASLTFARTDPGSVLVIPRTVVRRHGGRAWVTVVGDRSIADSDVTLPDAPTTTQLSQRVRYAGASAAEIAWLDAVDHAVRRIRAGELEKVVLARDRLVYSDQPFDLGALLTRLRARFPSCFTFRVAGLVGASPELLIRRQGKRVTSLVLAGTARRGVDDDEDRRLGAALLASDKDLAEHRPAVASVEATLGPLTTDLAVDDTPHLLRLANVQHLATAVSGVLDTPVDALSLALRLHPTAAVGGMPTDRALAVIDELETIDRGRYAGPVGWVDGDGDGEFAIALRCAQIDDARARLFAGAGIVRDSLPESELEETRLKLRAMQSAF
jgi:menaquinone-specific isochorismate synthase